MIMNQEIILYIYICQIAGIIKRENIGLLLTVEMKKWFFF